MDDPTGLHGQHGIATDTAASTACGTATARAWSGRFDQPDQLAQALRDADVAYLSLQRGDFDARLSALDLGRASVQIARDGPHISRGAVAPGVVLLLLPLGAVAEGLRINGCRPTPHDALVLGERAGLHAVVPGSQSWATLAFGEHTLPSFGLDAMLTAAGDFRLHGGLVDRAGRLQSTLIELEQLAAYAPERIATGSVAAAMLEALSCQLAAGLRDGGRPERPGRALRHSIRLVTAAEEFADAHHGPIYTQDLADALSVAPRTLHAAFSAVFAMSPHRYLRVRRMNLVRRALLDGRQTPALIKTVALDHGFWHLGRFAQEYRALFGENPSSTRREAQPAMAGSRWRASPAR